MMAGRASECARRASQPRSSPADRLAHFNCRQCIYCLDPKMRAALQRLESVAAGGRTHAARHRAAIGPGDKRWLEWPLYEVLRP